MTFPVILMVIVLGVQACALKPGPTAEEIQAQTLANARIPAAWTAAASLPDASDGQWLGPFQDEQLNAYVAEAFAYNLDLSLAAARTQRAAALVKVAGGKLYPAVNALGVAGAEESGDGVGLEGVIANAAWELDVWGRIRYGVRGSQDEYAAAQADYAFARQSLAALVAKSWLLAIEAHLQRQLAEEMVEAAAQLVSLAERRYQVGIGSELDVSISRVHLDTYRDSALQLELAYGQSLRALETLLGRYPAGEIATSRRLPRLGTQPPAGLPSQLLERRPDVIAAARRVGAAFNLAQQARMARLPSISIVGSGSDLSSDLFILQERDNPVWNLGGRVLAPLFSGGSLKAQVAVRTAEQKQAMAAYASTAVKAFADVEDALSSELAMGRREAVLAASVADAERAVVFAQVRYRIGSGDLRAVEQQQLAYHSVRTRLLRVQSEQRVQRVNLHLALGGDF